MTTRKPRIVPDLGQCQAFVEGGRCPRPATNRRWGIPMCRPHAHLKQAFVTRASLRETKGQTDGD